MADDCATEFKSAHEINRRERARRRQAERALARQLEYQERKSARVRERATQIVARMRQSSERVREMIEGVRPISPSVRVLEVGSGAHGLIFFFEAETRVGVDPLAIEYARLFPEWQNRARTIAAAGEQLPFTDNSFDVVLCDNVVDHAEDPAQIVAEMARVLTPGGVLYFTVNTHHPVYALAAALHTTWNALGLRYEIGPFADHTVHLTPQRARALFDGLPLRLLRQQTFIEEAKQMSRQRRARHLGDKLKRVFYKNALYGVIALKN